MPKKLLNAVIGRDDFAYSALDSVRRVKTRCFINWRTLHAEAYNVVITWQLCDIRVVNASAL